MKITLLFIAFIIGSSTYAQSDLLENKSLLPKSCMQPFYHGVASGDPMKDRVIIWTRVTPIDEQERPIVVSWKMATDTSMTDIVQSGSLITTHERDYTVKVDVDGLLPDTWYYYEFSAIGKKSIQGRTRTTPLETATKDSLRFAVVSCANLEAGFFNVYGAINERKDVDAIICLGDYIYEYETGGYAPNPATNRINEPRHEILSLDDYRMRHSIYKLDPDLSRSHQLFPWFCIWDDHESADNSWLNGAENHNSGEGSWADRKEASKKAYFEWLPIRDNVTAGQYEIYRSASYGKLADIFFLDTRLTGRSKQVSWGSSSLGNSNRSLLGSTQLNWYLNKLSTSRATYKITAQQVMMSPLTIFGAAVNMDQWDGYPAERSRVLNHVLQEGIQNFVVLTGDIHTSWAMDIPIGASKVGVEFVTPSVTSPGMDFGSGIGESVITSANSHIKWVNMNQKGFMLIDVNKNRIQSDWYFVNTINERNASFYWAKSYYTLRDHSKLIETQSIALPRADVFGVIPQECPRSTPDLPTEEDDLAINTTNSAILLGIYPNPVSTVVNIQFAHAVTGQLQLKLTDLNGKTLFKEQFICPQGSWIQQVDLSDYESGMYTLSIESEGQVPLIRKIVKQ